MTVPVLRMTKDIGRLRRACQEARPHHQVLFGPVENFADSAAGTVQAQDGKGSLDRFNIILTPQPCGRDIRVYVSVVAFPPLHSTPQPSAAARWAEAWFACSSPRSCTDTGVPLPKSELAVPRRNACQPPGSCSTARTANGPACRRWRSVCGPYSRRRT